MSPVITSCEPADGSVYLRYVPRENLAYTIGVHIYREGSAESGYSMERIIAEGTPTDGASVPRLFWIFWPKFGPWIRAALYHDDDYRRQMIRRRKADANFLEMMADDGVGWWSRHCIWAAVRLFGWIYWNRQAAINAAHAAALEEEQSR